MAVGEHTVTVVPLQPVYLASLAERSTDRFLGTPCRTELAPHIGETVTVTVDIGTTNPTQIRVFPYQGTGISIADQAIFDVTPTYQTFSFVTTVKDWGGDIVTFNPGNIAIYDDSDAGGTVWVRNMTVRAGTSHTVNNMLRDPAMKGTSEQWGGVTYSGGVATITTTVDSYSPNVSAHVGTVVTGLITLRNPTAAAISTDFAVWGTVNELFAGGSSNSGIPVTVQPGQTVTVRYVHTLAGADNGARLRSSTGYGLVIESALMALSSAGVAYDGPYFDGDTPDTPANVYRWSGSPGDSPSTRTVNDDAVDLSCLVDTVSITHGRNDATTQPDAPSATFDLSHTNGEFPLPASVEVGAQLEVTTTIGAHVSPRFVGTITDISLGWEDRGEDTPNAGMGQIIAVGALAQTARRVIGDVPWPQELDGARVSRIMAAAGVVLNPAMSDPGTMQILARDVDARPALDLARGVAVSASGIVWQTKAGEIRYADADHRRGVVSSLTLDACDLGVTPTWRRTLEGLTNDVSIGYGVAPEGGDRPVFTAENTSSKGRYGEYGYSLTTELAALADAQALGLLLMTRNAAPVWVMAALPVLTEDLDTARYTAVLDLEVNAIVTLTGLPAISTAPTSAVLWVEGWRERLAAGLHEFELVVSGYCRTVPPPRWNDLDPGWTWDTLPAALTWDSVTCLGPPATFGRWDDVPASTRWDDVPATTTWDTWK